MRGLSRWLLRGLTAAVPVVIAACYGMAYRYSRAGKVVDATTSSGIAGLRVTCVKGGAETTVRTGDDGSFTVRAPGPCDELRIEDGDGDQNGAYAAKTLPYPPGDDEIRVVLDKAP